MKSVTRFVAGHLSFSFLLSAAEVSLLNGYAVLTFTKNKGITLTRKEGYDQRKLLVQQQNGELSGLDIYENHVSQFNGQSWNEWMRIIYLNEEWRKVKKFTRCPVFLVSLVEGDIPVLAQVNVIEEEVGYDNDDHVSYETTLLDAGGGVLHIQKRHVSTRTQIRAIINEMQSDI